MQGTSEYSLELTPRTMARVQENPELLQGIVQQLQEEEILHDIIEGENEATEESSASMQAPDEMSKTIWVDAAVRLLLSSVKELRDQVGKSVKLKNKKKMWERIKEILDSAGYEFNITQIENKYKGLERTFKKTKSHNSKTGRDRRTCPYEREMEDITHNRASVFPEIILGGRSSDEMSRGEIFSASSSTEPVPCSSMAAACEQQDSPDLDVVTDSLDTPSTSKRVSKQDEILNELKIMREERKQFQSKMIKSVENLDQQQKEKNEIARERNQLLREKNEILKEMLK